MPVLLVWAEKQSPGYTCWMLAGRLRLRESYVVTLLCKVTESGSGGRAGGLDRLGWAVEPMLLEIFLSTPYVARDYPIH